MLIDKLKNQARQLALVDAILWVGFLQGDSKRNALADADVFVLPSYSENFGVSVVEAMGAGLPVIVSDQVGLHQEIADAEAGVVVACDIDQLNAALIRLITNVELRRTMGANAAVLAKLFSPHTVALQLQQAYLQVIEERGRPAVLSSSLV